MLRAFLSHSSSDKDSYVRVVANHLGDRAVLDEVSFEEGMPTFEEIFRTLDNTDLFVIFLSDAALQSSWVQSELDAASHLSAEGALERIYPIIIDNKITYADRRIPDWIRREYNLKLVSRPSVAARRIEHQLRVMSWQRHPRVKEREQIFVGRNNLIRQFEERVDTIGRPMPVCLIASGLPGSGRKALLRHCLRKASIVREGYEAPRITLSSDESIEDFIQRIYDLGFSSDVDVSNLLLRSVEEKAGIVRTLLHDALHAREVIFVDDNHCIVTHDGLSPWFEVVLKELRRFDKPVLAVASRSRLFSRNRPSSDIVLALQTPEMDISERAGLLKRYIDSIGLNLSDTDLHFVADLLTGLPEQVFFTVDLIEEQGINYVKRNASQIVEFSTYRISRLLSAVEHDEDAVEFLALLAEFDFISETMLLGIAGESVENHRRLARFYSLAICEPLGATREYVRLNDAIRDYVQRSYRLSDEFRARLTSHLKAFLRDASSEERDLGDVLYSVRASLLRGLEVDSKYLIPSHFLKTIKELYDTERRTDQVIMLADRVLQSSVYIDSDIESEIRILLCLALARRVEPRFFVEIKKIPSLPESEEHFLQGFYQRHAGNLVRAIEHFQAALAARAHFPRAKNELARIYIQLEEYDLALPLALSTYEASSHNTYFIRTYFEALVHVRMTPERESALQTLLSQLQRLTVIRADEWYLNAQAQYAAFHDRNATHGLRLLDEAESRAENPVYHLFTKLQIFREFGMVRPMKRVLNELRSRGISEDSSWGTRLLRMTAFAHALSGELDKAMEIANSKLVSRQPGTVQAKLVSELRAAVSRRGRGR